MKQLEQWVTTGVIPKEPCWNVPNPFTAALNLSTTLHAPPRNPPDSLQLLQAGQSTWTDLNPSTLKHHLAAGISNNSNLNRPSNPLRVLIWPHVMWISSGRRASTPPVHLNSPSTVPDGQLRRTWGSHFTEGLFRIVPNRNAISWNRFTELGVIRKRLLRHLSSSSSRDLKRRIFTAGLSSRTWTTAQCPSLRAIRPRIPLMDRSISIIIIRMPLTIRMIGRPEARISRSGTVTSTPKSLGRIWCRPLEDSTLLHLRIWLLRPALLFILRFSTEEVM